MKNPGLSMDTIKNSTDKKRHPFKIRFHKVEPGCYVNETTGKAIIISEDRRTYHIGSVRIRRKKYRYVRYRDGASVKEIYLGVKSATNKKGLETIWPHGGRPKRRASA